MKNIKPVHEAKGSQQSVGKNVQIDKIPSSYNDGSKNGSSDTPHQRTQTNSNRTARPGPVPAYSGNKSAQKLRG
jgi:hypothetical protein